MNIFVYNSEKAIILYVFLGSQKNLAGLQEQLVVAPALKLPIFPIQSTAHICYRH